MSVLSCVMNRQALAMNLLLQDASHCTAGALLAQAGLLASHCHRHASRFVGAGELVREGFASTLKRHKMEMKYLLIRP